MIPQFHKARAFGLAALVMVFVLAFMPQMAAAVDTTEVVNPADLSTTLLATDWHIAFTAGTPTHAIISGPATPPMGTGSLQMTTAAGVDKRYIMNYDHAGQLLSSITHLGYSTYGNSSTLTVVLQVQIDPDGAGPGVPKLGGGTTNFSTVSFEPYYANTVTPNAWQTWNVLTDGAAVWGSQVEGDAGNGNNGTLSNAATWAEFTALYPNAVIAGVGLNVGSGWNTPFTGHADALKIGYSGDTVTYDFDPAIACTTVCYADAVNGNDLNGGASAADAKKTIQAAVNAVSAGGQVIAAAGTYAENVTIPKSLTLTGAGQTNDAAGTVLEGTGMTGSAIFVNTGITDVTIENLRAQNYNLSPSGSAGVYGNGQNHNFTVQNVTSVNNGFTNANGGGVYMNGPVDNVLIDHVTATNNRSRGIVIWNGFKTNITITNNTVTGNTCCGIELQDGTASGVTATDNTVSGNADSGMAFTGLMAGAGPNRIADNTLTNNGRFGIEIKLPNGTGLATGDGSIVVEDNDVTLNTPSADLRDFGGIVVIRRGWVAGNNNVDIPTGVIVRNNTVTGYAQSNAGSNSTGFGIVIEGTNMRATGNTLNNNDVGVQAQAGHTPYTANTNVDGNQNNLADDYFGRGNSPVTCATILPNTFSGNGVNSRTVGAAGGLVTNTNTGEGFCTIQAAVSDADTVDGHTISVPAGTYVEQVTVTKSLTLVGPDGATNTTIKAPATIPVASNPNSYVVQFSGAGVQAEISGFTVSGPGPTGCGSMGAGIVVRDGAYANIHDNKIVDIRDTGNSGCQNGNAIVVGRMAWSTTGTADITDNEIIRYQKTGILVDNTGSSATIEGNTISGDGPTTAIAENGIQISRGATAEINDNTVSGHSYSPATATSAALLLWNTGTVNTDGNTVSENQMGIWVLDTSGTHQNNTISATAAGSGQQAFWGIVVDAPPPGMTPSPVDGEVAGPGAANAVTPSIPVATQTVVVTGNTFTSDNTAGGVGLATYAGYGALDIDLTATKNLIHNWGTGVEVFECTGSCTGSTFTNLDINRNSIVDNTNGMYADTVDPAETDATCNWWGDASGPSGEGPGTGDTVTTEADFTPWLYSDDLDGPCFIGGTIAIDKVAAGGGTTEFTFDVSWSAGHVTLTDADAAEVSPLLQAGNYAISEINLPTGWSLQSATCDNTATVPVETANPSNIPLADSDAWVCTFTNVYTPPPANTCPVNAASNQWTDLLGIGMGQPKKHKNQAKLNIPNSTNLVDLYGQLVAHDSGQARYVRFIKPGKNNYVQVDSVTSPVDHIFGNFWFGADLYDTGAKPKFVTGKWFLQKSGTKGHIPRAFVLYPTYNDPANTYVNVWDTFTGAEGEVYWDTAQGWTPYREIVVPIPAPLGPETFHIELALADNDKDNRQVWVTVTAGGVTQTVMPNNPNKGDQLNLLVFDLPNVPAGTDEIVIEVYSPSPTIDGFNGDSAMLVGMTANYQCSPIP